MTTTEPTKVPSAAPRVPPSSKKLAMELPASKGFLASVVAPSKVPVKASSKASVPASVKTVRKPTAPKVITKSAAKAPAKPAAKKSIAPVPKPKKTKAAQTHAKRAPKIKMVRDSFTFPDVEHQQLVELKKRLIALGTETKKGELVRAGLVLLAALDNRKLITAVAAVEKLKTGRPKK